MQDKCFSEKGWLIAEKVAPLVNQYDAVLAGGTALALHLGHRVSVDLDFFSAMTFSVDKLLFELSRLELPMKILDQSNSHLVATIDGVKFSLFNYPYPFKAEPVKYRGLLIAGVLDIASMKIIAISQRGTKRDFVDLYCILQQTPIGSIAANMAERYGRERINSIHIGKSLVYFGDAESDYDPEYLTDREMDWEKIKYYFKRHCKSLVYALDAVYDARS
jgi:hypothetical protein